MIFIDTGAFLARHVQRDGHHELARLAWEDLSAAPLRCFTSNFVLDETITLLGRRTSYPFAAERARALLTSSALEILRPTYEDELRALEHFERFSDQGISFTDCVSFALMKRERIRLVFTFDHHFAFAGFIPWLGQESSVHEPAV